MKILTELGYLNGRDCIFLDQVTFKDGWPDHVILKGEINLSLCGNEIVVPQALFKLLFCEVKAFKVIELELWDYSSESSFDEVLDSSWIEEIENEELVNYHHYVIQTYDHVFEIICKNYHLHIIKNQ